MDNWIPGSMIVVVVLGGLLAAAVAIPVLGVFGWLLYEIFTM